MARFAVKTLEFDKVKALLASKTATSLGKAQALAIRTESEFSIVKRLKQPRHCACWMKGKDSPLAARITLWLLLSMPN